MSEDNQYPRDGNGWNTYSKLVLAELRRLDADINKAHETLKNIEVEIATLKIKSSFWGAVSGLATVLGYIFIQQLGK